MTGFKTWLRIDQCSSEHWKGKSQTFYKEAVKTSALKCYGKVIDEDRTVRGKVKWQMELKVF